MGTETIWHPDPDQNIWVRVRATEIVPIWYNVAIKFWVQIRVGDRDCVWQCKWAITLRVVAIWVKASQIWVKVIFILFMVEGSTSQQSKVLLDLIILQSIFTPWSAWHLPIHRRFTYMHSKHHWRHPGGEWRNLLERAGSRAGPQHVLIHRKPILLQIEQFHCLVKTTINGELR